MDLDKNRDKPRIYFPSLRLALHSYKAVENEFSTALYECKAVARCATRKTDTAINRIKTVGAHKLRIENTYIVNRIKTVEGLLGIGLYEPI